MCHSLFKQSPAGGLLSCFQCFATTNDSPSYGLTHRLFWFCQSVCNNMAVLTNVSFSWARLFPYPRSWSIIKALCQSSVNEFWHRSNPKDGRYIHKSLNTCCLSVSPKCIIPPLVFGPLFFHSPLSLNSYPPTWILTWTFPSLLFCFLCPLNVF